MGRITWLVFGQALMFSVLAAAAAPMAKPNCTVQCGGVDISYPFGIGTRCSIGGWFEILCIENSTVPLLSRTRQRVTSISVEQGTITVRNPITYSKCGPGLEEGQQSPSLVGSPFRYSQSKNRYTSVACGSIALMNDTTRGSTVGGCLSICGDRISFPSNNSCNGNLGCCQTTTPPDLQGFTTSFMDVDRGDDDRTRDPCQYAFLVDFEWFSHNVSRLSALRGARDVPVVLEWGLYNTTQEVFGTFVETHSNRSVYEWEHPYYYGGIGYREDETGELVPYTNSTCFESRGVLSSFMNRSLLECSCPEGFEGNAYLLYGCRDIDECKNEHICLPSSTCFNTAGYYGCYYRRTKKSPVKMILIGIGSGLGALFLLIGAWRSYRIINKKLNIRRRRMNFKRNGGLLLQQEISSAKENSHVDKTKLFNSKELEKATDKFNADRILGQGGQGTVYKGMLVDGKIVAVKKSKIEDQDQVSQFINEVVILSQINHRNVVKLLGCCLETEVPLLVYEFVPNGTLSKYIHSENEEFPLSWETRVRIATEVAGALSYLHTSASTPIFHRDIKSTNILLDDKYRAKIADFGTSRSISLDKTHLTTLVLGTFGYLDPEYFQSSQFTDKSDVYSFGVVLVELLSGQKPISVSTDSDKARGLAIYFVQCMEENRLFDIVDSRVAKEGEREAIMAFASLAKRCLNSNGRKRPTMREVATFLEEIGRTVNKSTIGQSNKEAAELEKDVIEENWISYGSSTWSNSYGSENFSLSEGIPLVSPKPK